MAASPFADMAVSWFYLGGSLPGLLLLTEDNNATLRDYLAELQKLVKEYSVFAQQDQGKQQRLAAAAAAAATAAAHQQQQQQRAARTADELSTSDASNGNTNTGHTSSSGGSSAHKKLSRFFKSRSSKESSSSNSTNADSDSTISMISSHNGLMISSTNSNSSQGGGGGGTTGSSLSGSTSAASGAGGGGGSSGSSSDGGASDLSLLAVVHLPFTPDVHETFMSLCDIWIAAYRHMLDFSPGAQTNADRDALLSLDDWLKTELISPVIQKVDMLSKTLVYEESNKLDSLLIHAK